MNDVPAYASVSSCFDSSPSLLLFCLHIKAYSVGDETDPRELPVCLGLPYTLFLMPGTLFLLPLILWVSAHMSLCPGRLP